MQRLFFEILQKVRTKFCPLSCEMSLEPSRNCSKNLFRWTLFLLWVDSGGGFSSSECKGASFQPKLSECFFRWKVLAKPVCRNASGFLYEVWGFRWGFSWRIFPVHPPPPKILLERSASKIREQVPLLKKAKIAKRNPVCPTLKLKSGVVPAHTHTPPEFRVTVLPTEAVGVLEGFFVKEKGGLFFTLETTRATETTGEPQDEISETTSF